MAIISFDKDENMNSESSVVEKYLEYHIKCHWCNWKPPKAFNTVCANLTFT